MQRENAAVLMDKIIKKITEAASLHIIIIPEVSFGILEVCNFVLGPAKLEVWHKNPRWRLDLSVGQYHGTVISNEEADYLLKHGQWFRTRSRISERPEFKLALFRLTDLATISHLVLQENVFNNEPIWIIQGAGEGATISWWVRKRDLAIRQVKVEGVHFEFEHGGAKKRGQVPGTFVLRVETIEFNETVPDELFQVPSNVAPKEPEEYEDLFDRIEQVLLTHIFGLTDLKKP